MTWLCTLVLVGLCWWIGKDLKIRSPDPRATRLQRDAVVSPRHALDADAAIESALLAIDTRKAEWEQGQAELGDSKLASTTREPQVDPEWEAFPRSEIEPGYYISALSSTMSASSLFRNKFLNPNDSYLAPPQRASLENFLISIRASVDSMESAVSKAANEEAGRLFGSVPHIELPKISKQHVDEEGNIHELEGVPISSLGPGVILYRDGQYYGISMRDLPSARDMYARRAYLVVEIGAVITAWFQFHANLTPSEADAILQNIVAHAERTRDLARRQ
ncbi:MAG: hypothetical protein AB7I19_03695 [Planctomycetota bacterium]